MCRHSFSAPIHGSVMNNHYPATLASKGLCPETFPQDSGPGSRVPVRHILQTIALPYTSKVCIRCPFFFGLNDFFCMDREVLIIILNQLTLRCMALQHHLSKMHPLHFTTTRPNSYNCNL